MKQTVLVIEDDEAMRRSVCTLLNRAGHGTLEAASGPQGLRALYDDRPAAVLLDVTLGDMDGWQVLARIRDLSDVPVLMLSGQDSEAGKVRALQGGADDYITKPYGRQELLARIAAALRRASGAPGSRERHERYEDGVLVVDHELREVRVRGQLIEVTPLEYRLLTALVDHSDRVLSHEQLLEFGWGDVGRVGREQVKIRLAGLRRKLASSGDPAPLIETRRGFGYRYRPPSV
jgi:DNA-binding response OmpR family regulator